VVVSTYNFWGCKDIKSQPEYEKLVEKYLENVEKPLKKGLSRGKYIVNQAN